MYAMPHIFMPCSVCKNVRTIDDVQKDDTGTVVRRRRVMSVNQMYVDLYWHPAGCTVRSISVRSMYVECQVAGRQNVTTGCSMQRGKKMSLTNRDHLFGMWVFIHNVISRDVAMPRQAWPGLSVIDKMQKIKDLRPGHCHCH